MVGGRVDRDFGHEAEAAHQDAASFLPDLEVLHDGVEPTRQLLPGRDFIDFYGRSWLVLHSYARRLVNDPFEAEELVQDAFLKLFIAMPELENEGHALAFMRTTIRNLSIDRYRKHSRRPSLGPLGEEHHEIASEDAHIDPVVAAEDAVVIREALSKLKWEHREALIAWEIEGASTAEIAARIGVDEKNVKHTLNRARAALRKLLVGTAVDPEVDLSIPEQLAVAGGRIRDAAPKAGALLLLPVLLAMSVTLRDGKDTTAAPEARPPSAQLPREQASPASGEEVVKPPTLDRSPKLQAGPSDRKRDIGTRPPHQPMSNGDEPLPGPRLSFAANRSIRALVAPRLVGIANSPPSTSIQNAGMRWNYSTLTDAGVIVLRSELQMSDAGLVWTVRPFFGSQGEFLAGGALTAPVILRRDSQGAFTLSGSFQVPPDRVSVVVTQARVEESQAASVPERFDIKLSISPDLRSVLSQKVTTIF